jgi:hypothetical protein
MVKAAGSFNDPDLIVDIPIESVYIDITRNKKEEYFVGK